MSPVLFERAHTHSHTETHRKTDPLALSSFSCDVIEAELQTLRARG